MDEEDGRPGALVAQVGQADVLKDALPLSLRPEKHAKLTIPGASPRFSGPSHRLTGEHRSGRTPQGEPHSNHNQKGRRQLAPPQVVEENKNENVPGK